MTTQRVNLSGRGYEIHIGCGVLDRAGELVSAVCNGTLAAIVTNHRIGELYAGRLTESLARAGIRAHTIVIPTGERYKNLHTVRRVYERLLDHQIDRTGMVIGLGGGVVGDLTGFVAATYLRGVDFVQAPTSLLAQVDASVGGKVGVDLPRGKNLVGAFYQPKAVLIDIGTLFTLPPRELRCGLAEVIKHGIILDSGYFEYVGRNLPAVRCLVPEVLERVVSGSCAIKARIVEQDERETSGLRAVLNYGHTVGHALESVTGYRTYRHGEAVAIGMVTAALVADAMGIAEPGLPHRIASVLKAAGLPTKPKTRASGETMLGAMKLDKKVLHGRLRFVLVKSIGEALVSDQVTPELLKSALEAQMAL